MNLIDRSIFRYFLSIYFFVFLFFFSFIFIINLKDFGLVTSFDFILLSLATSFKDLLKISDFVLLITSLAFFSYIKNRLNFITIITNGAIEFQKIFSILNYIVLAFFLANLIINDFASRRILKHNAYDVSHFSLVSLKKDDIICTYYAQRDEDYILRVKNLICLNKENQLFEKDSTSINSKINDKKIYENIKPSEIEQSFMLSVQRAKYLSIITKIKILLKKPDYDINFMNEIHEEILQMFFLFFSYFNSLTISIKFNKTYQRHESEVFKYIKSFGILILSRNTIILMLGKFSKFHLFEKISLIAAIYLGILLLSNGRASWSIGSSSSKSS